MKAHQEYSVPSGYFTEAYAHLAEQLSMIPCPRCLKLHHPSLKPVARCVYVHDGVSPPEVVIAAKESLLPEMPDYKLTKTKSALLGYSGGKDSVAMAIKLEREGMDVKAFHVRNLNRSCTDEMQASIDTCKLLDIPLIIKPVATHGPTTRIENPVKNLLVLAMMLDHGGPLGVANYSIGTQVDRPNGMDGFNTDLDFSDSPDVIFIGSEFFRQVPGFTLRAAELGRWNIDMLYSIELVLSHEKGMELLKASRSCMTQFRFKDMRRKHNEKKFGVKLLPGRCGSCWKCCMEYLLLESMGAVKTNKGFVEKCWDYIKSQKLTHWDSIIADMFKIAKNWKGRKV